MRRMIRSWKVGDYNVRLDSRNVKLISTEMLKLSKQCPSEFSRHPRSLQDVDKWKATEFRQFLYYFGPAILKGILPKTVYDHFLILHVAITILSSKRYITFLSYAEQLLKTFVAQSEKLYGIIFISYNVNSLKEN